MSKEVGLVVISWGVRPGCGWTWEDGTNRVRLKRIEVPCSTEGNRLTLFGT